MSATATRWKEVARRTGEGVEVALLWDESVRRLKVTVSDERLCHHLDFDVDDAIGLRAFSDAFGDTATDVVANANRKGPDV